MGKFHSASHLGRGGIEIEFTPSLAAWITRGEVEKLETLLQGRLQVAAFHNKPLVRIHELQKQILLLKTMKAGL